MFTGAPVTWPILTVVTFLPLVGALMIYISRGDDEAAQENSRWIALWATLITFGVSVLLVTGFDPTRSGFQFEEKVFPFVSNLFRIAPNAGRKVTTERIGQVVITGLPSRI